MPPCHHFGAEGELAEVDASSLIDGILFSEHQHQLARKPPISHHMAVGRPHRKVEANIRLHSPLIWQMQLVRSAQAIVSALVPNWPLDYILMAELWALWIWWAGQKARGKAAGSSQNREAWSSVAAYILFSDLARSSSVAAVVKLLQCRWRGREHFCLILGM